MQDPIEMYQQKGFAIFKAFELDEVKILKQFAVDWMYQLLEPWIGKDEREKYPLESYHAWFQELGVDHDTLFLAKNRYTIPEQSIKNILLNPKIHHFLTKIGINHYEKWDEGLGWLAFRFIRPGMGDGYPTSRKEWGPAKRVISSWIPIIGYDSSVTLTMALGSHIREYEKYLPNDSKFMKGEYRLKNPPLDLEFFQPTLEAGQVIFYHPRLLHSEDIKVSQSTRFSLEYRLNPA